MADTLRNASDYYMRNALGDISHVEPTASTSTISRTDTPSNNSAWSIFDGRQTRRSVDQNPRNYTSPNPSPDELVIKERGRRSLPVKWSPIPLASPQKPIIETPVRGNTLSAKSPRKRLQLNDVNELEQNRKTLFSSLPAMKKPCSPPVKITTEYEETIKKLPKEKLVDVLTALAIKHPQVADDLQEMIPLTNVEYLVEEIVSLKKEVFRCLPTSRLASKTDSRAFCKAVPHIANLKSAIQSHCKRLSSHELWESLLEYVFLVWPIIRALPKWDSEAHISCSQLFCFKTLSEFCLKSLEKLPTIAEKFISETLQKLEQCKGDHPSVDSCIIYLNKFKAIE